MKTLSKILVSFILCCSTVSIAQKNAITVTVTGSGEPIVLLSGFATSGDEVWQPVVQQLSKTYQCHVINYAGFAGMEPVEFPWLPRVVASIEDYISTNNLEKPIIIGHSLGGTIGIHLTANKELKISNLIIVDALPATGALMMPNFKPENFQYDSPYNNQLLQMDDTAFHQMATGMAAGMATDLNDQQQIIQWMKNTDRKTYVYGYTDYLKFDVREDLKEIDVPVTILGAGKPYGEEMAKANYSKQYENLANYELSINADSAHFIMMDQPLWFMNQLKTALK